MNVWNERDWADVWEEYRNASILQRTQARYPERWKAFFDRVGDIWLEMMGNSELVSGLVVEHLLQNRLVFAGSRILDIGCGPGALSLALVAKGGRVTAVDSSTAMIRMLIDSCPPELASNLDPCVMDWYRLKTETPFDLVIASNFPDAMSPSGIERMESFSQGYCAFCVGWGGREPFPIKEKLWNALMDEPLTAGGWQVGCAVNFLMTSGRFPTLIHLETPIRVDTSVKTIQEYYVHHFAVFGVSESKTLQAFQNLPADWFQKDRYLRVGVQHNALIWWKAKAERKQPVQGSPSHVFIAAPSQGPVFGNGRP